MDIPPTLFVTRKWPPAVGGMETWSVRMADELAKLGRVEVVALPGRPDGSAPATWRLLLFPFVVIARFLGAKPRPATVHLGDMALWPLGLVLGAGRRTVVSAHGTDVAYHRRGGFRGTLYGAYLRLGAKLLPEAQVVANSAATAAAAAETGWRTAAIVPLATDLRAGDAAPGHDGSILFAGRLVTRKGCGWFVREVLPLLPEGTRLRIAGTPWDPSEAWVMNDPRVDYLGALPPAELARAYASAMCVVVPNIEPANGEFEGFGLVACEAAACGAVVLAARTGGLVEAVRDSETGFLLPSGDAAAWAKAIAEVKDWAPSRRARFLCQAAAAAARHYSWRRVARETAAVYAGGAFGLQA
jgi:glycosyltransferase involved in cell wall biosynthesis